MRVWLEGVVVATNCVKPWILIEIMYYWLLS